MNANYGIFEKANFWKTQKRILTLPCALKGKKRLHVKNLTMITSVLTIGSGCARPCLPSTMADAKPAGEITIYKFTTKNIHADLLNFKTYTCLNFCAINAITNRTDLQPLRRLQTTNPKPPSRETARGLGIRGKFACSPRGLPPQLTASSRLRNHSPALARRVAIARSNRHHFPAATEVLEAVTQSPTIAVQVSTIYHIHFPIRIINN